MKKILIPILLLFATVAHAQLNNSWIDYSKAYYKFKLGKSGLYRISQPVLAAANSTLGNTPAEQFQLWRNGQQVRIYTSVTSGPLGSNDYIEFLGQANDGLPDKNLYIDPTYQLCDSFSLFTDTATYFLTVNSTGGNLRYGSGANNNVNNLSPDAYFMRRVAMPYKNQVNRGFAVEVGEPIYSAAYDQGEGWTSSDIGVCPGCDLVKEFDSLNVYTAGPANSLTCKIAAFTNNGYPTRNFRVKIFDKVILDTPNVKYYSIINKTISNLSLALLSSPDFATVSMGIYNSDQPNSDYAVVASVSLTYPAKFNFNNQKNFYFELAPSLNGNYLVINNFNNGAVAPVLYDVNNGIRYAGDITSTPGQVKFALPGSIDSVRRFMLVSEDAGNVLPVKALTNKTFINYSIADNQGDYLIISNPVLYNDGSGNNNVEAYRAYRASPSGGSFNAKVISIDELTDQFAFGIKKHPAAIRDFIISSQSQSWAVKPKYVFLIGRGMTTEEYRENELAPTIEQQDLVQSFGWPASDMLLACKAGEMVPLVAIGRLSVVNGGEIRNYLDKMQEYEQAQTSIGQTVAGKGWMKDFIHVSGGADSIENVEFVSILNGFKQIVENDTLLGGHVSTFQKQSTAYIEQFSGAQIQQLINSGTGFIGYFGHSSSNTLAFNLSEPADYKNQYKYPFFDVNGCSAGNMFGFDPNRLSGNSTDLSISENWVLSKESGSIGFLASTHLGIPTYLQSYNNTFYTEFCRTMYGNTIGNQLKAVLQTLGGTPQLLAQNGGFFMRLHLEEITLHGDPALKLNYFSLPDFVVEDQMVKISPSIISVADSSFTVSINMQNIGRAVEDSMKVVVERKLPNGTIQLLYDKLVPTFFYGDSLNLTVHINPVTDKGENSIIVILDSGNRVNELSEANNTITKTFTIFEDELNPVYPYNYSIVNQQNITYSASSANPLGGSRQYLMEIDTTALFNSPFKKQFSSNGPGGIIQFTPTNISFIDSTVYYWRVSIVPLSNSTPTIWNSFSFVYLANSSSGFNQSHYYQHLNSSYNNISLDADRVFRFAKQQRKLTIATGLYPYADYDRIYENLDFNELELYGCKYNSLQVMVYDTATITPWKNYNVNGQGRFGSYTVCPPTSTTPAVRGFFEFPYDDASTPNAATYRKNLMAFLDSIPNGMYVSITNLGATTNPYPLVIPPNVTFIDKWKADTVTLGHGNSLYDKLKSLGFTKIDSFTHNIPFVFFYQKGTSNFTQQFVGPEDTLIVATIPLSTGTTSGTIESPLFGPAKKWTSLHWNSKSIDPVLTDSMNIQVYGIKADGTQALLATVFPAKDTSLSFIDPVKYPYVKLGMLNSDSVYVTPSQLSFWRINADYVPEGAVAPNIVFNMKDTVNQGDKIAFAMAFKNISTVPFDSLTFKFIITNNDANQSYIISIPKGKALISGDTLVIRDTIDTKYLAGNNTLYVMVNPNNDQPEQYLFNNSIYKNFYVAADKYNPQLDVTFDGIHILNNDLVSAKPHVVIKLQDENKSLSLNDTSLIKVQVYFPDPTGLSNGNLVTYHFGDSMQFIPANLATGQNTATINLTGNFPVDGQYELIVSGKDVQGNPTGNLEYRVAFNVINKTMISNLFNYPNPFTTSTAFVFTLTGSELPQNMRIQILTITGKVVKEITQSELGPIHVGDNITQYRWDGTDMYGQKLANGVYLYRVLTNLNGKSIEKFNGVNANGKIISDGLNSTNKYFTKGYGKMYLMR